MELKRVRLKELRKKAGLTQEQLADKIGVRQTVISQMERGIFMPSVDYAVRVLSAFRDFGFEFNLEDFYEYGEVEGKMTARPANQTQLEATM